MSNKKKSVKLVITLLTAVFGSALAIGVGGAAAFFRYLNRPERYSPIPTDIHNIKLIAHRGMSSLAPENTTASFELAGKNGGFWGAECDIYRSTDGRWILSHDPNTFRMMDRALRIESESYEELMKLTVNRGSEIEKYPNLKICTLEEYLDICKKYNMAAIIEVKGKNNTEYYPEVVSAVEERGVNALYISFHIEDLRKLREITDAPLYLLVREFKREHTELVKTVENCGIDFFCSKVTVSNGNIIKCIEEGTDLIAWTVNDVDLLRKVVDLGVKKITTDRIYIASE